MTLPEAPETRLTQPTLCGVTQDVWISPGQVQALRLEVDSRYGEPYYFILVLRGGAEIKLDQPVPSPWGDHRERFERARQELEVQFWPTGDPYRT